MSIVTDMTGIPPNMVVIGFAVVVRAVAAGVSDPAPEGRDELDEADGVWRR